MSELKSTLVNTHDKIKAYRNYNDELGREYVELLKSTYQLLKENKSNDLGRKLGTRMDAALKAISVEIKDRFDAHYFVMRDKKKQDEFNYSKLIVLGVLKKLNSSL